MSILNLKDVQVNNKRILVRVDLNVPMKDGKILSDARIDSVLPTIKYLIENGAAVILLSHLGRPKEGIYSVKDSLEPIALSLSHKLCQFVRFEKNWLEGINIKKGEIVLCENVRFNIGEKSNSESLSKKIADLCDVFVMDAFATSHRAHSSTYGVAQFSKVACAGFLLEKELKALTVSLKSPTRPLIAIVGGAKVSTKLTVLENLIDKVDTLIVGGGIANTFLKAQGYNIGNSLYEESLVETAKNLLEKAKNNKCNFPLPIDVIVSKEFSSDANPVQKLISDIDSCEMILDIGEESSKNLDLYLENAGTIVWNGPVGVFEFSGFDKGTKKLANTIADSEAFSLAGGGDTILAIEKFIDKNKVSYISTAGGAFLEFLEGKKLPCVDILEKRAL